MKNGQRKAQNIRVRLTQCFAGAVLMAAYSSTAFAAPIDLSAWDIDNPANLRFGVVTRHPEHTYLSRLRQSIPRKPTQSVNVSAKPAPFLKDVSKEASADHFKISALTHGVLNQLGGRFGSFTKAPAYAEAEMTAQGLALGVDLKSPGYAGLWIQLGQFTAQKHTFLDASAVTYLSFWVKGQGDYRLKLSDQKWFAKEDAQDIGPLTNYLAPQVSNTQAEEQKKGVVPEQWRQVIVPLDTEKLPGRLDMSNLATLVLQAETSGKSLIRLRDLSLHKATPPAVPPADDFKTQSVVSPAQYSTWVWETEELLKDPSRWPPLVMALRAAKVNTVFLQLPQNFDISTALPELIKTFHQSEIEVHALDGDPHFALAKNHDKVLNTLSNLALYQQARTAEARFDGIHYDIEPYLLPGFFGAQQNQILRDYVQLAKTMHWRSQLMSLPLGFSLPFWLDMPDEFTGEPLDIAVDGKAQSLQAHLQDYSDYVALMDYKTQFWGKSGIYESALTELNYARPRQKKVYIGLETMALPDEELFLFKGEPQPNRPSDTALVMFQVEDRWQYQLLQAGEPLPPVLTRGQQSSPLFWPLTPYAQVKSEQLSFAKKGAQPLQRVLNQMNDALAEDPAFAGVALHHSKSLIQLLANTTTSTEK